MISLGKLISGEPGICVCQNVDSVILLNPSISQPRIAEHVELVDNYGPKDANEEERGRDGYQ